MKTLLLLRHAKSSWSSPGLDDHDRPLNGRGKRDAPKMGRLIVAEGLEPDHVLSSTAARAQATWERLAPELPEWDGTVISDGDLYHAAPTTIAALVTRLPDACQRAMVVAHNPGLEEFLGALTGAWETMPTACLARIDLEIESWSLLSVDGAARLVELWRPKELARSAFEQ